MHTAQTEPCYSLTPTLMLCNILSTRCPLEKQVLSHLPDWLVSLRLWLSKRSQKESVSLGTNNILQYIRGLEHSFPIWLPLLSFSQGQYERTEMVPRVILSDISWTAAWEHKHTSWQYRPVIAGHYACNCGVLIG